MGVRQKERLKTCKVFLSTQPQSFQNKAKEKELVVSEQNPGATA